MWAQTRIDSLKKPHLAQYRRESALTGSTPCLLFTGHNKAQRGSVSVRGCTATMYMWFKLIMCCDSSMLPSPCIGIGCNALQPLHAWLL